ncbi:hypothetical protein EXIGLDRAFT_764453 [Exidia glandulosa HHB12029]|uniref:CxC1-like cysteine cluster associated with KDZ transposases domain-containing protein n=1 Tax=Exidia glandulosa HHB12029 TaxID=1314781 RepID=A0A165L498_EXIGL|nr:hypothetical protein EXIGLDRAFT_764453 [Exidia glandulosa HHB12029]
MSVPFTPLKKRPTKYNRYRGTASQRPALFLDGGMSGPNPGQKKHKQGKRSAPKPIEDAFLPGLPIQTHEQIRQAAAQAGAAHGIHVEVDNTPRFLAEDSDEPMSFDDNGVPPRSPDVPRYPPPPPSRAKRSRKPRPEKTRVFLNWTTLLPELHTPYLQRKATAGGPHRTICTDTTCTKRIANVTCVYWDRFERRSFSHCGHAPLAHQIVAAGLFPSAPENARFAFCVDLLDFYFHLFHHSADSASAAAASISAFHRERGYILRNRHGQTISEGYKRPLQFAIQWYDIMKSQIETKASESLAQSAAAQAPERPDNGQTAHPDVDMQDVPAPHTAPTGGDATPRCSEFLRRCCPLCFEELTFGRGADEGMDFHVAVDANFNQRHNSAAGDCPPPGYEYVYQLSPDRVARMEERLVEEGKRPRPYRAEVPEEVIAGCHQSHEAGDPSKHKTAGKQFDDKGMLALVCRHDAPLCFANVADPGEGQKYALAAIEWLFEHIPDTATVVTLYDIGCVTDRTRTLYDVLPLGVSERLIFATSAMHAYAHQWTCQLGYNPRFKPGLGLSDGEGVERLWSRLRKLIGITRWVSRERRLILLDRQLKYVGDTIRADLPRWIARRRKAISKKRWEASELLFESGHGLASAKEQWALQREAELSLSSQPESRLRREMQAVLALQDQIDTVQTAITNAGHEITRGDRSAASRRARASIGRLEVKHEQLVLEASELYATLNIQGDFQEIAGLGLEFTSTLLQAHEARRNCRERLIEQFHEWSRLDAASGGAHQPLGTSLHQRARAALQKRAPALQRAISRYNKLCARLERLRPNGSTFPLPEPLSTDLKKVRDDGAYLQDVYVSQNVGPAPLWVTDPTLRSAIRAMHVLQRCDEEEQRLSRETANYHHWLIRHSTALCLAARGPANTLLLPLFRQEAAQLEATIHSARSSGVLSTGDATSLLSITAHLLPTPTTPAMRSSINADDSDSEDDSEDSEMDLEELRLREGDIALAVMDEDWEPDLLSGIGNLTVVPTRRVSRNPTIDAVQITFSAAPPLPQKHVLPVPPIGLQYETDILDLPLPRAGSTTEAAHALSSQGYAELKSVTSPLGEDVFYCVVAALRTISRPSASKYAIIHPAVVSAWEDGMSAMLLTADPMFRHVGNASAIMVPVYSSSQTSLAVVWPAKGVIELYSAVQTPEMVHRHAKIAAAFVEELAALREDPTTMPAGRDTGWVTWIRAPKDAIDDFDQSVWVSAVVHALFNGKAMTDLTSLTCCRYRQFLTHVVLHRTEPNF